MRKILRFNYAHWSCSIVVPWRKSNNNISTNIQSFPGTSSVKLVIGTFARQCDKLLRKHVRNFLITLINVPCEECRSCMKKKQELEQETTGRKIDDGMRHFSYFFANCFWILWEFSILMKMVSQLVERCSRLLFSFRPLINLAVIILIIFIFFPLFVSLFL